MPATNVPWSIPLFRFKPGYPGQFGVPGTDSERGIRSDTEGAIFYVNPNHVDPNNQRDGTDPEAPLRTVAAAIAKCQPYRNDVIVVSPNNSWQFGRAADGYRTAISEEVTLNVPGVRIVGLAPSGQGVYWYPASNGGTCITVTAIDCTIEGFFFDEGPTYTGCNAISSIWDGVTSWGENLTVRNCTFTDTVDTAIQLEYSWYCEIAHNHFWQCDAYGIYVDPAGSGIAYASIHDNVFHDCDVAMALNGADQCHIYRNSIYNGNAEGAALATDEGIDTTNGRQNQVFNNFFSCLLPAGANGDWDDLNTAAATDAWIANECLNGPNVTNPT